MNIFKGLVRKRDNQGYSYYNLKEVVYISELRLGDQISQTEIFWEFDLVFGSGMKFTFSKLSKFDGPIQLGKCYKYQIPPSPLLYELRELFISNLGFNYLEVHPKFNLLILKITKI